MLLKGVFVFALLALLPLVMAQAFNYNDPDFVVNDFVTYGSGYVNSSGLTVSNEGDVYGTIILYSQPLPIANGFYTEFTISISNCDPGYSGADGFTFVLFPQLPAAFSPAGGSNLGVTGSYNLATVGFVLNGDTLAVCAVNSSANLGQGSLVDDTTHCILNNTIANALSGLRCSGPHTIIISFTSPATWEVLIDNNSVYLFTKDITEILNWNSEYTGYVGFSGGVGAGWMNQRITNWAFSTTVGCLGTCDPSAQCTVFYDESSNPMTANCTCPPGFYGDGTEPCLPINTNANIIPILECYEKYGEANFEAFYGYRSFENETVVIPRGANNEFIGWEVLWENPIYFEPGRTPFYPMEAFSIEFEATDPITITWRLANAEVSFMSNDTSKLCSADLQVLLRFKTGRELDANETSLILDQLYNLFGISYGRLSVRNITYTTTMAKRDTTQLAELEIEISGTNSTTQNEPRASQVVQQFVDAATNSTLMNEVVNPDTENPDPAREFVDLKSTGSGTETLGQVLPTPVTPATPGAPLAPSGSPSSPSNPETPSSVPITSSATSTTLIGQMIGLLILTCSLHVL
jgi:hypothetical protein